MLCHIVPCTLPFGICGVPSAVPCRAVCCVSCAVLRHVRPCVLHSSYARSCVRCSVRCCVLCCVRCCYMCGVPQLCLGHTQPLPGDSGLNFSVELPADWSPPGACRHIIRNKHQRGGNVNPRAHPKSETDQKNPSYRSYSSYWDIPATNPGFVVCSPAKFGGHSEADFSGAYTKMSGFFEMIGGKSSRLKHATAQEIRRAQRNRTLPLGRLC